MEIRAFAPLYGPSAAANTTGTAGSLLPSTTVSATSSAVASGIFAGGVTSGRAQLQIANTSGAWAYVNFGNVGIGVTAATVAAGYPVAPGAVVVVSVDPEVNGASVILGTGTGTVVFTRGEGL
jgi:hypothetical protein